VTAQSASTAASLRWARFEFGAGQPYDFNAPEIAQVVGRQPFTQMSRRFRPFFDSRIGRISNLNSI
jgi:hypothetical protein